MNFSFYISGTPNGYNQYPADGNSVLLQNFAQDNTTESQLTAYRKGQLIYYAYLRYGLLSKSSNEDAFLGICMVFNGVCFIDVKGFHELFKNLYSQMVSKEEVIKKDRTGNIIYNVKEFIEKEEIINDCKAFLQDKIDKQFSQKGIDYIELDNSFDQSNTTPKTLSFNTENSEIINAIRKYGQVILYSPEISAERVLADNSGKLKNAKWILPLSVVVILFATLIIFSGRVDTSGAGKTHEVASISTMSNFIVGKYSCTMDSPQEKRLRIEITYDTLSHRFWANLNNYDYKDKLRSEIFIDVEGKVMHNDILGKGEITRNSYGDIEIISKPKNEKKWKMRKH